MEHNSKWNKGSSSIGEAVYMPEVSVGTCKNVKNCRQFNVDLANGHCVFCWDRGIRTNAEQGQKRLVKKDIIKATKQRKNGSMLTKGRKSRLTHIQAGANTWLL